MIIMNLMILLLLTAVPGSTIQEDPTGFCAAAPGVALRTSCAWPFATSAVPTARVLTSAFDAPGLHSVVKALIAEIMGIVLMAYASVQMDIAGIIVKLPRKLCSSQNQSTKEISAEDLNLEDIVNYKLQDEPIFYNYSITADCNDNVFYLAHSYLSFFKNKSGKDYIFCSSTMRFDSYSLNEELGLELIWEDEIKKDRLGLEYHPRFYTGNFDEYFAKEN